jgi:hypothetical protein
MSDDLIKLARPEDIDQKPSIALHLLVKNGAKVVGRLIDNVGPYINQVVAVLNDCTDDTHFEVARHGLDHNLNVRLVDVGRKSHPELYVLDVPETYREGKSLVGECYEGPFTGNLILADWASARNEGWTKGSMEWRLMLDADDVVEDPECIPGLCQLMESQGLDVLASRYHYGHTLTGVPRADAFRERLVRNRPEIAWRGRVHECLAGYNPARVAHVEGNLVVHDRRDSDGSEIRIPGRNLKVLYLHARRHDWQLTPREMIYLAAESRIVMPRLAARLVEMHLAVSTWAEEKAWAASIMGEIFENEENFAMAAGWYEKSLSYHPGVLAAMRLSRVRFRQGLWAECIAAYERGIANKDHPQFLDGGIIYEDATKIFVAASLRKLGRLREAAELAGKLREQFPDSPTLQQMYGRFDLDADRMKS